MCVVQAEAKYVKALELKEDFYEAVIASGQQLFERAKLLSSATGGDAKAKAKLEGQVGEKGGPITSESPSDRHSGTRCLSAAL